MTYKKETLPEVWGTVTLYASKNQPTYVFRSIEEMINWWLQCANLVHIEIKQKEKTYTVKHRYANGNIEISEPKTFKMNEWSVIKTFENQWPELSSEEPFWTEEDVITTVYYYTPTTCYLDKK